MAQVVPNLQLDVGGLVALDQSPRLLVQQFLGRQVLSRVGAFMRKIDLLIAQHLATSDHDQQRGQATQCRLQDGADQRVGQKLVCGVHLGGVST